MTIGQYLRPSEAHLPVARWWPEAAFTEFKEAGEAMGIGHVEASPLTRSSYHAAEAAAVTIGHRIPAPSEGKPRYVAN